MTQARVRAESDGDQAMADALSVRPPLSLYIHMPWCVRKCPYCDFNSHALTPGIDLPEQAYIAALLQDLDADLLAFADAALAERPLISIFIGGGTPSLISPAAYEQLFHGLRQRLNWVGEIEITLEANPGTVEQGLFQGYRAVGINRLSIGVQSFNPAQLKALGRIHSGDEATRAATSARTAGLDNFNIDLMHGLPGQSLADAMADLQAALALEPVHLSWYQLTLEPNTVFYREQPVLPDEDTLADIQEAGQRLLADAGFVQYEVSAYARADRRCQHNLNYWQFGDYLGIGAGAHGKISDYHQGSLRVRRTTKTRTPKDYLAASADAGFCASIEAIASAELPFEFMLNALRLLDGVSLSLWAARTGLPLARIETVVAALQSQGLLADVPGRLCATELGQRYLNRVISAFLPE